jgi:membrane associated rhomboid family serine protease
VLLVVNVLVYALTELPGLLGPGGSLMGSGLDAAMETERGQAILGNLMLSRTDFHWWTLITYAFLHAGFWHILGNMITLWVFGQAVEDRLGRLGFLGLYLLGGIAAGLAHMAYTPSPVVGASGAVAAVTGAFLIMLPQVHIRCLLFFFIIGIYMIPAWAFIAFAIAKDFLMTGTGLSGNVATVAHIGGYFWGIGVASLVLWLRLIPRESYDLVSMVRQYQRRQEMRAAAEEATRASKVRQQQNGRQGGGAAGAGAVLEVGVPNFTVSAADAKTMDIRSRLMAAIDAASWAGVPPLVEELIADRGEQHPLATLPRDKQLLLANGLLESGNAAQAARAYRQFIAAYKKDSELVKIKLLLGIVLARHLGDAAAGKAVVEDVSELGLDDESRTLLKMLRG